MFTLFILCGQLLVNLGFMLAFFWGMALVHELGHAIIATILGGTWSIRWKRKSVLPILATHVTFTTPLQTKGNSLFTLAGILFQVLVSVVLVMQRSFLELRLLAITYFVVIGLNVVPIPPTDGYYFNLLMKYRWSQQRPGLTQIITITQWKCFLIALLLSNWSLLQALLFFVSTHQLFWLELGGISALVVIRSIFRIRKLTLVSSKPRKHGDSSDA